MRYRGALKIDAGQTQADPALADLDLCAGVISEVEILFPAGHSGLTYLQIWYLGRQIFPTSPGATFRGDGSVIEFGEQWVIQEVPHRLQLRGWAPDAELPHTIFVGISVQPLEIEPGLGSVPVGLPEGFE
ncbi:hypothetical protein ES708_10391 [subsurface metagenome]